MAAKTDHLAFAATDFARGARVTRDLEFMFGTNKRLKALLEPAYTRATIATVGPTLQRQKSVVQQFYGYESVTRQLKNASLVRAAMEGAAKPFALPNTYSAFRGISSLEHAKFLVRGGNAQYLRSTSALAAFNPKLPQVLVPGIDGLARDLYKSRFDVIGSAELRSRLVHIGTEVAEARTLELEGQGANYAQEGPPLEDPNVALDTGFAIARLLARSDEVQEQLDGVITELLAIRSGHRRDRILDFILGVFVAIILERV